MSKQLNTQTETSARQPESGFFADMILHATQAANSVQADMTHWLKTRIAHVPNILLIGENTGNTYYRSVAVEVRTDSGGEGISIRQRERSLLSSRIESFTKLPQDWGGADTVLIGRQTLDIANRLVRELPKKWPLPQVTSSPDGEIVFTWFNGGNRLEGVLQPDHHLVWIVKNNGKYYPGRDIDFGSVASFADLFEAIATLYQ